MEYIHLHYMAASSSPTVKKEDIHLHNICHKSARIGEILNPCQIRRKCHHLGVPSMAFVKKSTCCVRSKLSATVQKCCSYQLTPPGWPSRSIPGLDYSRNIKLLNSFAAHSHNINISNAIFLFDILKKYLVSSF